MIELYFLDALQYWRHEHPNGFSGTRKPRVPVAGRSMMIGANVVPGETSTAQILLTVNLNESGLAVEIAQEEGEPFQVLVIEHWKLQTPEYTKLIAKASSDGTESVQIGATDYLSGVEMYCAHWKMTLKQERMNGPATQKQIRLLQSA